MTIVRSVPARAIAVSGLALAFGIALVLVRGDPTVGSDQGIFLSVAGRMLDGDDLYADVIENKDPLVFYTYAGALWVGGWRGPFLLDGIWLALAALGCALLLRELRLPRAAVAAGFFVYPLALTATWFYTGLTMLGGLALAPFVPLLWLRRRYVAAGAMLATVMLFKINIVLVAGAPVAALFLLGVPETDRLRQLARAVGGAAAAVAVAAVVLLIWGGLREYLDSIVYNVDYANALLASDTTLGRMREHMRIVVDQFRVAGRWQLPAALLAVAVFAAIVGLTWTRRARARRVVATLAAFVLAATVLTLALTAYWDHHLQMLAYPAALMAATFVSVAATTIGPRAAIGMAVASVAFALWSSLKHEDGLAVSPGWTSTPISAGADALEKAQGRFYPDAETVTYMVFGGNSENGHAAFLRDEFELSCRWFYLAPISLDWQFEETLQCARRERPMLVLITLGFFDERQRLVPRWGRFVRAARRFLTSGYERVVLEHPGFEAWKRRGAAS